MEPGNQPDVFPSVPRDVPPELTRATARYRRHAWLALAGLLLFMAFYLALLGWFSWTAYRLLAVTFAGVGDGVDLVAGAASALLAAFLALALLAVKRGGAPTDLEVTAANQPELFTFLHRVADTVGAPRPHRVFLSPGVNAAVFYDLSFWNLLLPARKNLEIGLGLVNALNLSETTAVLGHEFGHFAQRSMAVGRWVYTAQQIAAHIVNSRGWLDRMLAGLSAIDVRVAWIGWVLRTVVWSIRAALDTAFSLVALAQRALSREMEFQADLVSVSLTGSDALIQALHRTGAADDAWGEAAGVAATELRQGRAVPDLFALQARVVTHVGRIMSNPQLGQSPPLPATGRAAHRVFENQLAEAPRMWSTHPSNRDREDNAKRVYVEAAQDQRPAWCLFRQPETLRRQVTERFLIDVQAARAASDGPRRKPEAAQAAAAAKVAEAEKVADDVALGAVDRRFDRPFLQDRYRGAYLGRSAVLHAREPAHLYGQAPAAAALPSALGTLYPESLAADLAELRNRIGEKARLDALHAGILQAPGGVIRYRGEVIKRRALPVLLARVDQELKEIRARVTEHDRACRTTHRAAAAELGQGWDAYLEGLARLLHYAGHLEADLEDARGHLNNVFAVVTADGQVSGKERVRLTNAAYQLYTSLAQVYEHRDLVKLPPTVLKRLELASWTEALPAAFELGAPSEGNLPDWLRVIDSWIGATLGPVGALERVSLEELLEAEAHVSRCFTVKEDPGVAPMAPALPAHYPTLVPGEERARQRRLDWWSRFQTADGFFPSVARLVAATAILGAVVGFSGQVGNGTITIYNALGTPVTVTLAGATHAIPAGTTRTVEGVSIGALAIETRTTAGELIEQFSGDLSPGFRTQIYTVAAAAPLVEWTVAYGNATPRPARQLGALRWRAASADVLFGEAPSQARSKTGGTTRTVVNRVPGGYPGQLMALAGSDDQRAAMVRAHVRWDDPTAPQLLDWLALAEELRLPELAEILRQRLARAPGDVPALRAEQDTASGGAKADVCARHRAQSQAHPAEVDLAYVADRCLTDEAARDRAFAAGSATHPENGWYARAHATMLAENHQFKAAAERLVVASDALPAASNEIGVELGRLLRALAPETSDPAQVRELNHWASRSPRLARLLALEKTEPDDRGPADPYTLLAQGQPAAAVRAADGEPTMSARVLRLAAASDGAGRDLVDAALKLPPDAGLDDGTVWAALALRARETAPRAGQASPGAAADPLLAAARALAGPLVDRLLPFTDRRFLAGGADAADRALGAVPPAVRGEAYAMALIVLGDAAPSRWRQEARGLLYVSERPFFK